jgi:hypothetical protein
MAEVRDAILQGAERKFQASPFVLLISGVKIKKRDP